MNTGNNLHYKFKAENFPQTDLNNYHPVDGVEIKLLDGCNRSCSFCVNEDYSGKDWNLVDIERFNKSFADWVNSSEEQEKPAIVYGTGGEPLIAMDTMDAIFSPVAALGLASRIVTNGTLLTKPRIQRMKSIGITGIKVTYNTTDGDRLAQLMGGSKPGDEKRILDNIANAKAAGFWVFVRIGVGQHNFDEIVEIYRLLSEIRVDVIQLKPWIPSGFAAKNQDELALSPRGLQDVFSHFVAELYDEIHAEGAPELTVSCYPPAREMGLIVKDCANIGKMYCEPSGATYVCNFSSEALGNWYAEEGGLLKCVANRRVLYKKMMDRHGVTSCPARYNWGKPSAVLSPFENFTSSSTQANKVT